VARHLCRKFTFVVGQIDPVSALRRAINLILALALVAVGGGGLFYVYFLTATPNGWMALAAGIVGAAGLYWLWDEHINAGPRPEK
jgi:hypothetical protein